MKLRIKGQSIRLRLSGQDLQNLGDRGEISEKLTFPGRGELYYGIRLSENSEKMTAQMVGTHIQINLPESLGHEWLNSESISLKDEQQNLKILVEKDLPCEHVEGMGKEKTYDGQ